MHKNEESFKAWYHGILAAASLAEVFTAKTTLRKALLVLASGWHARCTWEHIQEVQKENALLEGIEKWRNTPRYGVLSDYHFGGFTFPDKPVVPKKTVVYDEGTVWCEVPEVTNELRQGVPKPEGQAEALPKETTEGSSQLQTRRLVSLVPGKPRRKYTKKAARRPEGTTE